MADDADRSDKRIEDTVAAGIARVRSKLTQRMLAAVGYCHYCEEELPPGRLFCDKDCAGDWQYEQDRKRALGR